MADGRADAAVHSAKDMPSTMADHLVLGAVPPRADARDGLVGCTLAGLPAGGLVATGSARRRAQLAYLRPDLVFTDLRGNMARRVAVGRGRGGLGGGGGRRRHGAPGLAGPAERRARPDGRAAPGRARAPSRCSAGPTTTDTRRLLARHRPRAEPPRPARRAGRAGRARRELHRAGRGLRRGGGRRRRRRRRAAGVGAGGQRRRAHGDPHDAAGRGPRGASGTGWRGRCSTGGGAAIEGFDDGAAGARGARRDRLPGRRRPGRPRAAHPPRGRAAGAGRRRAARPPGQPGRPRPGAPGRR